MSSARPRPQNYPTVMLFVVGGVTCNEVRQVREVLTARKIEAQVSGELSEYIRNNIRFACAGFNWLYETIDSN